MYVAQDEACFCRSRWLSILVPLKEFTGFWVHYVQKLRGKSAKEPKPKLPFEAMLSMNRKKAYAYLPNQTSIFISKDS